MKKINIAIDGPAGAGKSTIAKLLAKELDYTYIDTGAMYRALTYLLIKEKIDLKDDKKIVSVLENNFDFQFVKEKVILNNEDVSLFLRSDEINEKISLIVVNEKVRKYMVAKQKQLGLKKGVVMDGRDIGNVVLKDAELKIFLTASLKLRADRRFKENQQKGINTSYEEVYNNLKKRDYVDTFISKALVKTKDSIEIDSSYMNIKEVVKTIINIMQKKVII